MPSSSGPQRGVRSVNRALLAACALVLVAVAAVTINASQRQAKVVLAADIIDPEGINPQRVVDVLDDLEASATMGRSKVRNVIAKAKKLMDKKLSIIVDTQTLKTGGRPGPIGNQGKQGYPGYQGIQGAEGDRGPTGPQGNNGPQGHEGPRGFRGTTGKIGIEGERGGQGEVGPNGFPGPAGPKGQTGTPGARGLRGGPGAGGFQGLNGAQGTPGERGVTGPQGTWEILDVTQKCKEKAGTMFRGVCLKLHKIQVNVDQAPPGCSPYNPNAGWSHGDMWDILRMLKPEGLPMSTHIRGDLDHQEGGWCNNFGPVIAYTYYSSHNHLYMRQGAFAYWYPGRHHHYWDWWWWVDVSTYCWIRGYATYACSITK